MEVAPISRRERYVDEDAMECYILYSPFYHGQRPTHHAQRHPRAWTLFLLHEDTPSTQRRGTPPRPSHNVHGILGRRRREIHDEDDNQDQGELRPANRRRVG
ncbi:hypothetical protein PCASD_00722 [Puccinia coronata f. sp. avenae]|nr:hypothetical protein PCASD_00722 [Puccinia coronata f. sp. avenae]